MAFYLETTPSNLPVLDPSEEILLVQDQVGLYFGDEKSFRHNNGTLYLTKKHIFYVDSVDPKKNSLKIKISDIRDVQHTSRYFRSSPKIRLSLRHVEKSWACKICTFINVGDPINPCRNCGVANRFTIIKPKSDARFSQGLCTACTFQNHPDLNTCEICGNQLKNVDRNQLIQLSFRGSGSSKFYEAIKSETDEIEKQRYSNKYDTKVLRKAILEKSLRMGGIHDLEQSHEMQLAKNGRTLVHAFQDLDAFFSLAKDTMSLADQFAEKMDGLTGTQQSDKVQQLLNKSNQLGVLRGNHLDNVPVSANSRLYDIELCKSISEVLRTRLKADTDTVTMTQAWAIYNRSRKANLIPPTRFVKACELIDSMEVGITTSKMNSGLILFQLKTSNHSGKLLSAILEVMNPSTTALKCAMRLHWSIGVTLERLYQAEMDGYIVRDVYEESGSSLLYWKNEFDKLSEELTKWFDEL